MALHSPSSYLVFQWLTGVPGSRLDDPVLPPRGLWLLCGFGRFGKGYEYQPDLGKFRETFGHALPAGAMVAEDVEAQELRLSAIQRMLDETVDSRSSVWLG